MKTWYPFNSRGTTLVTVATLFVAACSQDDDQSPSSTEGGRSGNGSVIGGTSGNGSVQGGASGTSTTPDVGGVSQTLGGNTSAGSTAVDDTMAGAIVGGATHAAGASAGGAILAGGTVGTSTGGSSADAGTPGAASAGNPASGGHTSPSSGATAGASFAAGGGGKGGAGPGGSTSVPVGGTAGNSAQGGEAPGGGTVGMAGMAGMAGVAGVADVGGASGVGGCTADLQCALKPGTPFCVNAKCVACEVGSLAHACVGASTCCAGSCVDPETDPLNCGTCGNNCDLAYATANCIAGKCGIASCESGHHDCDLDPSDGCEIYGSDCLCQPGAKEDCYTGPAGTRGVGTCHSGKHTCLILGTTWGACFDEVVPIPDSCYNSTDDDCNGIVNDGYPSAPGCACKPGTTAACYEGAAGTEGLGACHGGTKLCLAAGTAYDGCVGQVVPSSEICGNHIDDNCNGMVDEAADLDGDGWTTCAGDCCDSSGTACGSPKLVNPGAIEVPGDSVDNNCNGVIDEDPYLPCSTSQDFSTDVSATKALALLNAMEICQVAQDGKWGIVAGSPKLTRADGTGTPSYLQVAVMHQLGSDASNLPRLGDTMVSLSSGKARDNNGDPEPTTSITYSYASGNPPPDFVAAHGNSLPQTSAGCPAGSGANDAVLLRVQLKAPTNAQSFSFNFRFFSQEYWSYTCTNYNDFFIAMLDSTWLPGSGQTAIPADKNISFDSNHNYVSVNSQQFFTVCSPKTGYFCPGGTAALAGTGWASANAGATAWLTTTAPVVPGETITLRFVVWDTSDQALDSLVLVDNFRWSATASNGPVTGQ